MPSPLRRSGSRDQISDRNDCGEVGSVGPNIGNALASAPPHSFDFIAGDHWTSEDLFEKLPDRRRSAVGTVLERYKGMPNIFVHRGKLDGAGHRPYLVGKRSTQVRIVGQSVQPDRFGDNNR